MSNFQNLQNAQGITQQPPLIHQTAVKEVVKPIQVEEIQPVVHRQIETTEIHQVKQPIYERNVLPTQVQDRVLPTTVKPDVVFGGRPPAMIEEPSTRVVENVQASTITKPAIVEETFRPHIVEEIQPVVFRETVAPSVVREVQPINERIIQQPVVIQETRQPIYQGAGQQSGLGQQQAGFAPQSGFAQQSGLGQQQAGFAPQPGFAQQPGGFTQQPAGYYAQSSTPYSPPSQSQGSGGGLKNKLQNLLHHNKGGGKGTAGQTYTTSAPQQVYTTQQVPVYPAAPSGYSGAPAQETVVTTTTYTTNPTI